MSIELHDAAPTLAPAAPAPSAPVRALADRVREAAARGTALRIVGARQWLDAGRPVRERRSVEELDVGALRGIVEYVPGDLTLTALAGTPLSEIAEATAANGQWLALDPHGTDAGTIGATVATASSGPLATGFGTPRDAVLGVEFVTGTGAVVRGGGRVVKNVAGFDLVRLVTGAWGTLGAITEVTVRLRARPVVDVTLALPVAHARGGDTAAKLAVALRALPFVPYAAELVSSSLARELSMGSGIGDHDVLLVRIGGSPAAVEAQRDALVALASLAGASTGAMAEVRADAWARLRAADAGSGIIMRVSAVPSRFGEAWEAAARVATALPGTRTHGSVLRGVVRCLSPVPDSAPTAVAAAIADITRPVLELRRVFERLPSVLWPALAPTAIGDRLSSRLRDAFDPHGILNPGILGE